MQDEIMRGDMRCIERGGILKWVLVGSKGQQNAPGFCLHLGDGVFMYFILFPYLGGLVQVPLLTTTAGCLDQAMVFWDGFCQGSIMASPWGVLLAYAVRPPINPHSLACLPLSLSPLRHFGLGMRGCSA